MVNHLPPAVKNLLALRNPNSYPGPKVHALTAILSATLKEARQKKAENGWLVLSTCTLLTANTPSAVGDLYRFATRPDSINGESKRNFHDRLDIAAKMRESALKSTIFVGVPRVILSLSAMTDAFESDVKDGLRKDSHRTATLDNIEIFQKRGQALWKSIYEPHAEKLYNKLGSYHPDFICESSFLDIMCCFLRHSSLVAILWYRRDDLPSLAFIIQSYGVVLSPFPDEDHEQGNLSRALGSVVGTACLRAETRVGPQLTSHVFGLLKARSIENLDAEDRWLSSDEGTEWVINSIDKIYDVARGATPDEEFGQTKAKL